MSQCLVSNLLCILLGLPFQLDRLLLQEALLALEQGLVTKFLAIEESFIQLLLHQFFHLRLDLPKLFLRFLGSFAKLSIEKLLMLCD